MRPPPMRNHYVRGKKEGNLGSALKLVQGDEGGGREC